MITLINILFPIISIILLGVLIRRRGNFPEGFFQGINSLVFRFGITPLLFIKTAKMTVTYNEVLPSVGVLMATVPVLALAAWLTAIATSLPRRSRGGFIHAAMRGNYAYVGLPVIYYAFAHTPLAAKSTEIAIVIFTPTIIFHNILAIFILRHYNGGGRNEGWGYIARSILKDPLIMGCALGLAVNIAGLPVPTALARTCEALGGMALPLALIGIGATMDPALLRGNLWPPMAASFIKTFIGPVAAWALIAAAGIAMDGLYAQTLLLLAACSVGVSTYIVTEHYGGDGALVGSAVFISAVMSMVSLSILLVLFHGIG